MKSNQSNSYNNLVDTRGFAPILTDSVKFTNLEIGNSKNPSFVFRLNLASTDLSYDRHRCLATVAYIRDPKTGMFTLDMPLGAGGEGYKGVLPIDILDRSIVDLISQAWKRKYSHLRRLYAQDPNGYHAKYKDLAIINDQITKKITWRYQIIEQIQHQMKQIPERQLLPINEQLVFNDTVITKNSCVNSRLNYSDPCHHKSSKIEMNQMRQVLSTMMDDENLEIFLWFMGAVLSNKDAREIGKMLIVSDDSADYDANRFMNTVLGALLPGFYQPAISPIEQFSTRYNDLSYSNLPLHLTMFSSLTWLKQIVQKDKVSFDVNSFKRMVVDGKIDMHMTSKKSKTKRAIHTFYVCLADHFPKLSNDQTILNEHLLPFKLSFANGGEDAERQDWPRYLSEHRQVLADLCYQYYTNHPLKFSHCKYDQFNAVKAIDSDIEQIKTNIVKLAVGNPIDAIKQLGEQFDIDMNNLIFLLSSSDFQVATRPDFKYGNVFRTEKKNDHYILYINSTKKIMTELTGDERAKKVFTNVFGKPVKKFNRRMFKLG